MLRRWTDSNIGLREEEITRWTSSKTKQSSKSYWLHNPLLVWRLDKEQDTPGAVAEQQVSSLDCSFTCWNNLGVFRTSKTPLVRLSGLHGDWMLQIHFILAVVPYLGRAENAGPREMRDWKCRTGKCGTNTNNDFHIYACETDINSICGSLVRWISRITQRR